MTCRSLITPSLSQITGQISPIRLPDPSEASTRDVVTILGWGKQADTGGVSPDLKFVEVRLTDVSNLVSDLTGLQVSRISEAACSEYYGPLAPGVECVTGPSTCQVTRDDDDDTSWLIV